MPPKPVFRGESAHSYVIYHKTTWENVTKILVENCVRPASWAMSDGVPAQYPCYGFFGWAQEISDPDNLGAWVVGNLSSNLYKIGKGQNPSGILATCRGPKMLTAGAGGNDQIQRLCAIAGSARANKGASAMNSSCATVSYVASTQKVFPSLITNIPPAKRGQDSTPTPTPSLAGDPPEPRTASAEAPPPEPTSPAAPPDSANPPSHASHHRARTPRANSRDRHHHYTHRDSHNSWTRDFDDYPRDRSVRHEGASRHHHREDSSHSHAYRNSSRHDW